WSRGAGRRGWVGALSGAVLLALEVVWFRFLQLFLLSSTRGFAVMLVVVLLGIGAGGLLSALWLRFQPAAYRYFGHLALGAGLVTAWSYIAFEGVPQQFSGARTGDPAHMLALSLRLMLPVCLVSGVLFAFLARGVFEDCPEETRSTGWVTLFNTLGAAAGALLGGFLLLPRLGIELSFFLLALCYPGAALLSPRDWYWPSLRKISPAWAVLAVVSLLTFAAFPFGLMRDHFIPATARPYLLKDSRIAAVEEGLTETIIYLEHNYRGVPFGFQVMTNSYSMTAINPLAKRYMKLFAYWPLAFHPRVENALLISFGVGSTAEALTGARGIERIAVVDLSRDMVEFSDVVFGPQRRSPAADPRVRVFIEDGRFYLLTTGERYDLITAEPPPLMMAGVVNLYTQEYFDLLKRRLREGGYVTYWLPVWQLAAGDALSIVRGFCNVFEDCSLWNGGGMNLMLVGSRDASTGLNRRGFSRQWRDEKTAADLGSLGFENPELLLTTFVADANQLGQLAGERPPLTDNYPHRLGREVGRDDHYFAGLLAPQALVARYRDSDYLAQLLPPELRESAEAYFPCQQLVDRALVRFPKPPPLDLPALDRVLTDTNLRTVALWTLGGALETSGAIEQLVENGSIDGMVHYHLGLRLMAARRFLEAEDHFRRWQQLEGNRPNMFYFRILCFAYAGDMERARELVAELSLAGSPGQGDEQYWSFVGERFGLER
ncbi:MAG: fused MFS/spermidine synthase, partial [Gemmatimonadetes bacterium]|nr:fused MFS/spermidine synthase [Gemmatimonadota bacterium]